jgi:dTDP-4-amino-4,6-dideoxygalactose transaminase
MLCSEIGKGDEVIVPVNTFIATAEAISHAGATPVFVDVDEKTFNIDVNKIEEKITPHVKAINGVSLFGQPAELKPIKEIAEKNNLFVIEDAAQAHLAEYYDKRNWGDWRYCFMVFLSREKPRCLGRSRSDNN